MAKKSIHFRVEPDVYEALETHAHNLKVPPNTLARELFENSLYGRKQETILSAFEDSEKQNRAKFDELEKQIQELKTMLVEHQDASAMAMYVHLAMAEGAEKAKEYMKKIFPNWSLK